MPLASIITTAIISILGNLVARVMIGGGMAFITYQALDGYIEGFLDNFASSISGLPSDMYMLLSMSGVPSALEILGSAMLTVAAIRLTDRIVGVKMTG